MVDLLKLGKPVTIVGMMGVGKTHIGTKLAKKLGRDFFDSDDLIVKEQNQTIAQIFEKYGEKKFRELETQKITELLGNDNCIISTGGGALLCPKTLQAIQDKSISIWLKSDVESIFQRIKNDKSRPLLRCDDVKNKLQSLLNNRERLYAKADIHINNPLSARANNIVEQIIQELSIYENC